MLLTFEADLSFNQETPPAGMKTIMVHYLKKDEPLHLALNIFHMQRNGLEDPVVRQMAFIAEFSQMPAIPGLVRRTPIIWTARKHTKECLTTR